MVELERKSLLGAVLAVSLKGKRGTPGEVARQLGLGRARLDEELKALADEGFVDLKGGRVRLTAEGRSAIKVVFIGGGFEVIHRGHLHTIERAKALGDILVVSVARDSTIRKRKKREPVSNEKERVEMLSSLRQVDAPILGVEGDIYETLEKVKPDVVALGYDQYHMEAEVASEAKRRGLNLKVVRLDTPYPKVKTSRLLDDT